MSKDSVFIAADAIGIHLSHFTTTEKERTRQETAGAGVILEASGRQKCHGCPSGTSPEMSTGERFDNGPSSLSVHRTDAAYFLLI